MFNRGAGPERAEGRGRGGAEEAGQESACDHHGRRLPRGDREGHHRTAPKATVWVTIRAHKAAGGCRYRRPTRSWIACTRKRTRSTWPCARRRQPKTCPRLPLPASKVQRCRQLWWCRDNPHTLISFSFSLSFRIVPERRGREAAAAVLQEMHGIVGAGSS